MRIYTKADIARWVEQNHLVSADMRLLAEERTKAIETCSQLEQQLRDFMSATLHPSECALEQVKAKINCLILPEEIESLSKERDVLCSTDSTLGSKIEEYNRRIRPLNDVISDLEKQITDIRAKKDTVDQLTREVRSYEMKEMDERRQLALIQGEMLNVRLSLEALYAARAREQVAASFGDPHQHGHDHPHRGFPERRAHVHGRAHPGVIDALANTTRSLEIAMLEGKLKTLRDREFALMHSTTTTQLTTTQGQQAKESIQLSNLLSQYGNLENISGKIREKEQERAPLLRERDSVIHEKNTCAAKLSEVNRSYTKALETLRASRALVKTLSPDDLSTLQAAASSLERVLSAQQVEAERLKGVIREKQSFISAYTQRISEYDLRLSRLSNDSYIKTLAETPWVHCNDLLTKFNAQCSKYQLTHPCQQPMISRLMLLELSERFDTLSRLGDDPSDPLWRTEFLYGVVWNAIEQLEAHQEKALKEMLIEAFGEKSLDKEASLAVYAAFKGHLPQLTEESLNTQEQIQFDHAVRVFNRALNALGPDAPREQRHFYQRGKAMLEAIQKAIMSNRGKEGKPTDLKYYTSLLTHAHDYLLNPENIKYADAFHKVVNNNPEGQTQRGKKISGLALIFLGAGLFVANLLLMGLTAGLWTAAAPIGFGFGACLITLGGSALFANGGEKGVLKRGHDFERAGSKGLLSHWLKPELPPMATVVPPPHYEPSAPAFV